MGVKLTVNLTKKLVFFAGILDQVAMDVYGLRLSVQGKLPDVPHESNQEGYQYQFRLNFDNRNYMLVKMCKSIACGAVERERKINICPSAESRKPLAQLSSCILLQLFPFSLVFRSDMRAISVGCQLTRMFSGRPLLGKPLSDVARLRRPKINFTWENVRFHFKMLTLLQYTLDFFLYISICLRCTAVDHT